MIYLQDRSRTIYGNIDTELAIEEDIALDNNTNRQNGGDDDRQKKEEKVHHFCRSVYFWYLP